MAVDEDFGEETFSGLIYVLFCSLELQRNMYL